MKQSEKIPSGKIVFINACMRPQSRTRILAERILDGLSGEREEVCLGDGSIHGLDEQTLARRSDLAGTGDFSDPMFDYAKQFASADTILVAAPYWDMSFPAVLKCYLEQVCVVGLTFAYGEDEKAYGLCKAKKLIYVTTAGGWMVPEDLGYGYLKALTGYFYGIGRTYCLKAEGLDLWGADPEVIMAKALEEADALLDRIRAEENGTDLY